MGTPLSNGRKKYKQKEGRTLPSLYTPTQSDGIKIFTKYELLSKCISYYVWFCFRSCHLRLLKPINSMDITAHLSDFQSNSWNWNHHEKVIQHSSYRKSISNEIKYLKPGFWVISNWFQPFLSKLKKLTFFESIKPSSIV